MVTRSLEKTEVLPQIAGCRLVRLHGSGSSGDLYLAEDEATDRAVMVRFLPLGATFTQRDFRMIMRDLEIVEGLDHPLIAPVIRRLGEESGLYLLMQPVQGESLRDLLKSRALSQPRIVRMALQLVEVLQAAHGKGLSHRGLNSGRVFVGPEDVLSVLGFGLGMCYRPENTTRLETLAGMSPEQTRGERLDQRTDFFSLGTLLYEMVTRQNPFLGVNPEETLYRIHHSQPRPLAQQFPGTHMKLSALVDWLLQKDPERRPEDCAVIVPVLNEVAYDLSRS